MKALLNFVIIEPAPETPQVVGKMELGDEKVRFVSGKVISCGARVEGLSSGDEVKYDSSAGHRTRIGEFTRIIMRDGDIACIL